MGTKAHTDNLPSKEIDPKVVVEEKSKPDESSKSVIQDSTGGGGVIDRPTKNSVVKTMLRKEEHVTSKQLSEVLSIPWNVQTIPKAEMNSASFDKFYPSSNTELKWDNVVIYMLTYNSEESN